MIPERRLGRTGLMISRLVFGTLTISPLQRGLSAQRGSELIVYATDRGVNLFDTAELYDTYQPLALALKKRPGLMVATKSYAYDIPTAKKAFDEARRMLGKDVIDVFLLHEQESAHTMRGHREAFDFFLEKKAKGQIRAVGISTHRVEVVRQALRYPGVDVLHPLLNMGGIGIGDGSRQEMEAACQEAHRAGIGIYAMKALAGGHLLGKAEEAFAYVNGLPYIDGVAVGMQSEAEIDVNVALFSGEPPKAEALRIANAAPRELLIQDWCQGCGACVARCGQKALSLEGGRAVVQDDLCLHCGYCAKVCPEFCIKVI